MKAGLRPGEGAGDLLSGVDWGRTRAYALGLGGIYLNLEGREGQGTVKAGEADALKAAIAAGLRGLEDPGNGVAIREAICRNLDWAGISLDPNKNSVRGKEERISSVESDTEIWIVPTNEELIVARQTVAVLNAN